MIMIINYDDDYFGDDDNDGNDGDRLFTHIV